MRKLSSIVLIVSVLFLPNADAALSPLSISAAPPAQFPPSDFDVAGVRVNLLYGRHRNVSGLDVGLLVNNVEQKFRGLQIAGGANYNEGRAFAIGTQFAGLANLNEEQITVVGLQFATIANWNKAESSVAGLQLSLLNLTKHTDIYGFQLGLFNSARSVYGLQIGLINRATNLHGIQIGLLNFHKNGLFAVAPILNIGF